MVYVELNRAPILHPDGDEIFPLWDFSVTMQAQCNVFTQWRIQDFPLGGGGRRPIGGVPTFDTYTFRRKHMQKWKILILLGGGGHVPAAPPGSANVTACFCIDNVP